MARKSAIVCLAEGSEAIEVVGPTDFLRLAKFDVTLAGIAGPQAVKCNRGVVITPDISLKEVMNISYDVVVLPGGFEGAKNLAMSADVGKILKRQEKVDGFIAAICAAPTALRAHEIGFGKRLTSYPTKKEEVMEGNHYIYLEETVVVDGKLITSRGPGTTIAWALQIIETVCGKKVANETAKAMIVAREATTPDCGQQFM